MSTIKDLKKKLRYVLKKSDGKTQYIQPITPFIWGKPGIGKSQSVKQIADEYGIDFIDLRLSQLESADVRGLPFPDMENGISKWLPPEFLPFDDVKKFKGTSGILLLDEFNRARPDVLQAAFQLVLDRQVGMHKILDSWFIVAAGNLGEEDKTDVIEMDSALKNRFIHMNIDIDLDSWIEWANKAGINADIVNFIQNKPQYLYWVAKEEDNIFVTPRSWEKFSKILEQNNSVNPAEITSLLGPDIISSVAAFFIKYLESKEIVSGVDIITKYTKNKSIQAKVKAMQRDQIYALNNDVVDAIIKLSKEELNNNIIENVHVFITTVLEKDIYVAFLRNITKKCMDSANSNEFIDEYLKKYVDETKDLVKILKDKVNG
jgi:hypothetical protein